MNLQHDSEWCRLHWRQSAPRPRGGVHRRRGARHRPAPPRAAWLAGWRWGGFALPACQTMTHPCAHMYSSAQAGTTPGTSGSPATGRWVEQAAGADGPSVPAGGDGGGGATPGPHQPAGTRGNCGWRPQACTRAVEWAIQSGMAAECSGEVAEQGRPAWPQRGAASLDAGRHGQPGRRARALRPAWQ